MRAMRGPPDRKVDFVHVRPAAAKDTEAARADARGATGGSTSPGGSPGSLAGGAGAGGGNPGFRDAHQASGKIQGMDMTTKQKQVGGDDYTTDESDVGSGYPKYPAPSSSAIHLPSMSRGTRSPSDLRHDAPHGHAGPDHRTPGAGNFGATGGGNLSAAHSQKSALGRAKDTLIHGSRASYGDPNEESTQLPDAKAFRLLHSPSDVHGGLPRSNVGQDKRKNPPMNFRAGGAPGSSGY